MINKIHDAKNAMEALAENFELVVTGKRSLPVATVVQKNISSMVSLAKTQVLEKLRVNDKTPLMWLWIDEQQPLKKVVDQKKLHRRKQLTVK